MLFEWRKERTCFRFAPSKLLLRTSKKKKENLKDNTRKFETRKIQYKTSTWKKGDRCNYFYGRRQRIRYHYIELKNIFFGNNAITRVCAQRCIFLWTKQKENAYDETNGKRYQTLWFDTNFSNLRRDSVAPLFLMQKKMILSPAACAFHFDFRLSFGFINTSLFFLAFSK